MIKRFISFNFSIITTILVLVCFTSLYLRLRLLDEQIYINAFGQVESPKRISELVEENLENYLKSELVVDEDNSFPPKLTARIIRTILQNIDFENVLSESWAQNINYITLWLKGEQEFLLYFPKNLIIENYESAGSDENFINDLIEISGYSDLPVCNSEADIRNADYLNGEIECSGPILNEYIRNDFIERVGAVNGQTFLEGFLDQILGDVDENTQLSDENLNNFNNSKISKLPLYLDKTKTYSIVGIIISIITSFFTIRLSHKPALAFLKILGNVGVLLVILSLLSKVGIRIIADFLLWRNINFSPNTYNDKNISTIMDYLKDLTGALMDKLLVEFMIIGVVLIVVVIVLYFIFRVVRWITPDEDDDEYYEDETEEDGDEVEDDLHPVEIERFEKKLLNQDFEKK